MRRYFLLIALSIVYTIHLYLKFSKAAVPAFFSHYFADLLCMPLLYSYVLLFMRWFRGEPNLQLSAAMTVVGVVYVGMVFEFVLPFFFNRYTADIWDVWMYAIGGTVFYYLQPYLLPSHQEVK